MANLEAAPARPLLPTPPAAKPSWSSTAGDVAACGSSAASSSQAEGNQTAASASDAFTPEREADILRLQGELGFSRYQATEAFKRCSTAGAAVDWILSPEREWNQQ